MKKNVSIEYYALLREERGETDEKVATEAETAKDLYDELKARHGFTLERELCMVIVNENYSDWDTSLGDGDNIVFIPPVSGG